MHLINERDWQKLGKRLIPYISLVGIVGTTLLSLVRYVGWTMKLELLSHFQLQYLGITILLFGLILLTRPKYWVFVSFFCLGITLIAIIPWYIPQTNVGGESGKPLHVFLLNVHQRNKNYAKAISLVREENPDVAVFDEVNEGWIEQLNTLKDILPYSVEQVNPSSLGITIYSKLPLKNVAVDFFGTTDSPTILSDLSINGSVISLIAAHPLPPFKAAFFKSRNKQLEEMGKYVQQMKYPALIVGDLNITMWSPYYKKFIRQTELRNARQGFGILPSWPANSSVSRVPGTIAPLVSIPIDHYLMSPEIEVSKIRIGQNVGSDHLPVIADLVIPVKT
ncbi:MAG TPA: endonuclease/exonuclease/phosphatase family protein [Coleofasciculaceae cyanobacterium]